MRMFHFKKCANRAMKVCKSEKCKKNDARFSLPCNTFKKAKIRKVCICNKLIINHLTLIYILFHFFSTYNNNNNNIYIYKRI